jgi:hypothetical protein
VNLKSILGWAAAAFIVWWVMEEPTGAAHLVHNVGQFMSTGSAGISHFFTNI